jgi:hypothetical protein
MDSGGNAFCFSGKAGLDEVKYLHDLSGNGQRGQKLQPEEINMKLARATKNSNQKPAAAPVAGLVKTVTQTILSPAGPARSASPGAQSVTIEAKIDVGFGNTLFLRGEGKGLSWDHGIPLVCVDGSTWKWSGEAPGQLKFKLLLNDAVWSKGADFVATPGQQIRISPAF